jgi:hypothetical protein
MQCCVSGRGPQYSMLHGSMKTLCVHMHVHTDTPVHFCGKRGCITASRHGRMTVHV